MYVGHLAIGFAIKSKFPDVPAFPIILGTGFLDIIDGLLVMLGLNQVTANLNSGPYMYFDLTFVDWDHSLLMAIILSVVWGMFFLKDKKVAIVAGLSCFSHWLSDWPVHNFDLALYPYSVQHYGYGLWGKLGTMSWVLEGLFSLILIGYAWTNFSSRRQNVTWPMILLIFAFFNLSPWLSPMKLVATLSAPYDYLVEGFLVMIGFIGPGLLITWLIEREELKLKVN